MKPASPGSPTSDLVRMLARHWPLFVVALIPAGLLLVVSPGSSTSYVGSTTVAISAPPEASVRELRLFDAYVRRHIDTFAMVATMPVVLDEMIDSQDLTTTPEELARSITVIHPESRQYVSLEVAGTQRDATLRMAKALGTSAAAQIEALSPTTQQGGTLIRSQPGRASVSEISEQAPPIRAALAALAGMFAALGWVLLRFATDDVLRAPTDLTSITIAPVLATFRTGEDDEREMGLLHLHLTSAAMIAGRHLQVVGTTDDGVEAFAVRDRLLRTLGGSDEAPVHVDAVAMTRIGQTFRVSRHESTAILTAPSALVVVALRRVTGADVIRTLCAIEENGGVVAGLVVQWPRHHWIRRLGPRRRAPL